jgi:hypothetical protein
MTTESKYPLFILSDNKILNNIICIQNGINFRLQIKNPDIIPT